MTQRVTFVGPLPPPVHGFSTVCSIMLNFLRDRSAVVLFDRSPRSVFAINMAQQVLASLRYAVSCLGSHCHVLYLGVSGGLGQAFDCLFLLWARLFHQKVFVHHHSFAYLDRPSAINRLFFMLSRNATHIVLSHGMARALTTKYRIEADRIRVISNAAFYDSGASDAAESCAAAQPLRIGFLSNITFDKGFMEFFDVLESLHERGIPYEALIAGPVAVDARVTLERLCGNTPHVTYLGAVYGEQKERFYRDVQVLLFPTKYANEAEPLVIHEAMRASVHVVACDRGAIREILENGAGVVFTAEQFVTSATSYLASLSGNVMMLDQARSAARAQARLVHDAASSQLAAVLNEISCRAESNQR